ncbi:Low-density lipoprotein receptor- protein 3 [Branchiostoma belcheri]|nr:Low-density lipoprotein receptor- protein 3 [Branchiostoma belcheri]
MSPKPISCRRIDPLSPHRCGRAHAFHVNSASPDGQMRSDWNTLEAGMFACVCIVFNTRGGVACLDHRQAQVFARMTAADCTCNFSSRVVDAYSECGGSKTVKVVSQEGYIYSPGYPFGTNYPPHINCTWVIQAKPGQAIQLSYSYGCDFATDYLRIGNSNASYDFTYCDQRDPAPFKSRGNVVWVFFKTGQWRQRGFWLHYKAVGGATASDQPMPDNWAKNSVYYTSEGGSPGTIAVTLGSQDISTARKLSQQHKRIFTTGYLDDSDNMEYAGRVTTASR